MVRVLIIDDNRATADMLAKTFPWQAMGCEVAGVAYDGIRGYELILSRKPDILIADIRMPGMDGLQMVALAREACRDCRVIFVSAYDEFSYAQKAISLKAFAYLLKPFDAKDMQSLVREAVREIARERGDSRQGLAGESGFGGGGSGFDGDLNDAANAGGNPYADGASGGVSGYASGGVSGGADGGADVGAACDSLLVHNILSYIDTHISARLSLSELSTQFGLSPSYIGACIKKHTGRTYVDWLTESRLKLAKKLLCDPRYRVEEITGVVGYKNYITFYKVFVKHTGMSPSEYRRRQVGETGEEEAP